MSLPDWDSFAPDTGGGEYGDEYGGDDASGLSTSGARIERLITGTRRSRASRSRARQVAEEQSAAVVAHDRQVAGEQSMLSRSVGFTAGGAGMAPGFDDTGGDGDGGGGGTHSLVMGSTTPLPSTPRGLLGAGGGAGAARGRRVGYTALRNARGALGIGSAARGAGTNSGGDLTAEAAPGGESGRHIQYTVHRSGSIELDVGGAGGAGAGIASPSAAAMNVAAFTD